jgi:hypothetical protein
MRVMLWMVVVLVAVAWLSSSGGEKPCLTYPQLSMKVAKVDTYSRYDPRIPDTGVQAAGLGVDMIEIHGLEDRACAPALTKWEARGATAGTVSR